MIKKIFVYYLSVTLAAAPLITQFNLMNLLSFLSISGSILSFSDAMADEFKDNAVKGQTDGVAAIRGFALPSVNSTTGDVTVNNLSTPITIPRDSLYQGATSYGSNPASSYGNNGALNNLSNTTATDYLDTTNGAPPAAAYRTLVNAHPGRITSSMQNDPIATKARTIFSDQNGDISAIMNNCKTQTPTSASNGGVTTELEPDIKSCQRLEIANMSCSVKHTLTVEKMQADLEITASEKSNGSPMTYINNFGNINLNGLNTWGKCTLNLITGASSCTHVYASSFTRTLDMTVTNTLPSNVCSSLTVGQSIGWSNIVGDLYAEKSNPIFFGGIISVPSNIMQLVESNVELSPLNITVFPKTGIGNGKAGVDVIQAPNCNNGMTAIIEFGTVGCTTAYCVGSIDYKGKVNLTKVDDDSWTTSDDCPQVIQSIKDGTVCHGSITSSNLDAQKCTDISGVRVCPGDPIYQQLQSPPALLADFPDVTPLSTNIVVDKTCDPCMGITDGTCTPSAATNTCNLLNNCRTIRSDCADGMLSADGITCNSYEESRDCNNAITHTPNYHNCIEVPATTTSTLGTVRHCSKDANGFQTCQDINTSVPSNSCAAYETDATCKLVYDDCPLSLTDQDTDECVAHTKTYDCGYTIANQVTPTPTSTTAACSNSVIRCTGTDCISIPHESNANFGQVVSSSAIINYSQQDSDCATNPNCSFFKGQAYHCKAGFFGIVDCCSNPAPPNLVDYLKMISNTWELSQKTEIGESLVAEGSDLLGSFNQLLTSSSTYDEITTPIFSAYDELTSSVSDVTSSMIPWESLMPTISQSTYEFIGQTFGEQAASALFSESTNVAGEYVLNGAQLMANLAPFMYAYMIYQVVVLLVQIIYACQDSELELSAKTALKSCHYLGKYCSKRVLGFCLMRKKGFCCFNSPFSRIMQEQIRAQQGISWGSPKHPACQGLSLATISNTDFSKVNLSEWIGLLNVAGIQNTSTAGAATQWTVDSLTTYKGGTSGSTVYDRIEQTAGNPTVNMTNTREDVKATLW